MQRKLYVWHVAEIKIAITEVKKTLSSRKHAYIYMPKFDPLKPTFI